MIKQPITMVRIYLSESDHGRRKNLMEQIFSLLHDQHKVRGVTVFRGIAGFGSTGEVHSADLLHLTANLPLVIEFFDEPGRAQAAVDALIGIVPAGHLVEWSGTCFGLSPIDR